MIQTSFFPQLEKDEPIQIIQKIDTSTFQPVKMEEINYRSCADLLADTYMLYPGGGYHPFYGVPNTFPIYQLPIWPHVKRVKWTRPPKKKRGKQIQASISSKRGYVEVTLYKKGYFAANYYTQLNKYGDHYVNRKNKLQVTLYLHGLVAHAYIPNPQNKPQVMHINDDPTNFLPENLKWGTPGENMKGVKRHPITQEQKYSNLVHKGVIKG